MVEYLQLLCTVDDRSRWKEKTEELPIVAPVRQRSKVFRGKKAEKMYLMGIGRNRAQEGHFFLAHHQRLLMVCLYRKDI